MEILYDLIEQYLPGHSQSFRIETIEAKNGNDTYELDFKDGKIVLRGNNCGSAAAALGWYLKYTVKANLSWCGKNIPVFEKGKLPIPKPYHREIKQKYRVYMNYCTHSYSAAWWNWERWKYEIDMMALNGVNMPLAITGTESVWYKTLMELGFSDSEAREYLVGPAFLAWQWMTNIENHGGSLPKKWIDEHEALGKKILERELAFGMKPIQHGYSGCVPNVMAEKFPEAKFLTKKSWNNIGHTTEIEPLDPLFDKVGKIYMQKQKETFGLYGFYASDPFHEGEPPVEGDGYLQLVGKAISDFYKSFDENYTWVMQAWSIRKPIATAVPKEHLLILDLDCKFPVENEGYWGYDYIVGRLHNFGARMALHGDMRLLAENTFNKAKEYGGCPIGTGLFMEGIGQNPVYYDLGLEMLTRSDSVELYEWISKYIERRYGICDSSKQQAWKLLLDNIYTPDTDFVEKGSVICTRPCVELRGTGPQDSFDIHYDNKLLFEALEELKKDPVPAEGYWYDLSDLCRQYLSNCAYALYQKITKACIEIDYDEFSALSKQFLSLLDDFDRLLAIRPEWTIQKWIEDAKSHAENDEERKLYEYNARMQITVWGNEQGSYLFDYSWKEWSGLVSTYYKQRWLKFFDMIGQKLKNGEDYVSYERTLPVFENRIIWHADAFYTELADWEAQWLKNTESIPLNKPSADEVFRIIEQYRI